MASKVYFTDLRATGNRSLLDKMERLMEKAGFDRLISPGDLVAVKIHFGEQGNLAYIRPQYVRRVVDKIKALRGKSFVTDANTLYRGSRSNAVDHLETAIMNGFDYSVVGAPLMIADGLTGRDYIKVRIEGRHFTEVNIGAAAYHADAMIVMTHFKCHELTGIGGAIKNLGMGLGSRSGKQQMHSDFQPKVREDKCTGCGRCAEWCPTAAIRLEERGEGEKPKAVIDYEKCYGCGECVISCLFDSIRISWKTTPQVIQEKMVEYALGAVKNKQGKVGYLSFVMDISPECDCYGFNDVPITRDVGIFASLDPVALDLACAEAVNRLPGLAGSMLEGVGEGADKFQAVHPGIEWKYQLTYGQELGLGSMEYELIKV